MWQIYHKRYVWWIQLISSVCVLNKPLRETAHLVLSYSASFVAHIISWLFPFSVSHHLGGSWVPIPVLAVDQHWLLPCPLSGAGTQNVCWNSGISSSLKRRSRIWFLQATKLQAWRENEANSGGERKNSTTLESPAPTGSEAVLTLGSPIKCFVCKPGWGWALSHVRF